MTHIMESIGNEGKRPRIEPSLEQVELVSSVMSLVMYRFTPDISARKNVVDTQMTIHSRLVRDIWMPMAHETSREKLNVSRRTG